MVESKYQIETSSHRCGRCEREIACGAHYYSAVVFGGEVFARKDFCERCWLRARRDPGLPEPGSNGLEGEPPAARAAGHREGDAGGLPAAGEYYAFWRTRRPEAAAEAAPRVRFDADVVLGFFRRLGGEDAGAQPPDDAAVVEDGEASADGGDREAAERARKLFPIQRRNLRFVLALLLIRKKRLLLESSASENGREWLRLSERESPARVHWVENPELTDQELERVRDDIGELLQMAV
ncbi:MAG: hypothetical protein JXA90_14470 [Planctomycetes bacterium]|nr:hypothetical protein [Planctomycetota bacterium]